MLYPWKYKLLLVLGVAAIAAPAMYVYAPRLEEIAKPRWLDGITLAINRSAAAVKRQAEVSPVDPIAAANVDEDLDYRIAQRTKSMEGWRSFLSAHPGGPHAQSARAELDKLVIPVGPLASVAAEAPGRGRPEDAKIASEVAPQRPSSAGSEDAALASDEACSGDEDRLEQLSHSPTSDGVIRFLIELRCEKLRPQLLGLAERLDDKAPAAGTAQGAPSSALPGPLVSAAPLPPPRTRAKEPQTRTRSTLASRGVQPQRHVNRWAPPNLPPILLALFGEQPRNSSASRRTRGSGGSSGGGGNR
jgi:hypothetical protein